MSLIRQLRILAGGTEEDGMASAIKVAFAAADLKQVDQHFGTATTFVIYAVDAQASRLVEVVQFDVQAMDGNEGKLAAKLAALDGCVAVYCRAVGGAAIHRLQAQGIQPVKVGEDTRITDLVQRLQQTLQAGAEPWLVRALEARGARPQDRFEQMAAEGWTE